jgi:hypothetical protein
MPESYYSNRVKTYENITTVNMQSIMSHREIIINPKKPIKNGDREWKI